MGTYVLGLGHWNAKKATPTAAAGKNAPSDIQGVVSNRLPQTEPAVNDYSMQNSDIDAQGDLSLMDTLPQEKYLAELDKAVAEATAKSEEALKAAQAEGKELRRLLLDDRQQATAEAKMNDRWRNAETKLVAALAVSHNDHLP